MSFGIPLSIRQTVTHLRNGVTIGTYPAGVVDFTPEQIENIGMNPGFSFQRWKSVTFASPFPAIKLGDDLGLTDDTYFVAYVNPFPNVLQVVCWHFIYDLTADIVDQSGVVIVPDLPCIVAPTGTVQSLTSGPVQQASLDAFLFCPNNPAIRSGQSVRISAINGVAQTAPNRPTWGIRAVANRFMYGKVIQAQLFSRNKS